MKRRTISALLLGFAATAASGAASGDDGRRGFQRFLRRYEAANTAFQNGDPTLWMPLTARHDPASIFGGVRRPG